MAMLSERLSIFTATVLECHSACTRNNLTVISCVVKLGGIGLCQPKPAKHSTQSRSISQAFMFMCKVRPGALKWKCCSAAP